MSEYKRPVIASRPHNEHNYGEEAFWLKKGESELAKRLRLTVIIRQDDRTDESKMPKQFVNVGKPVPVFRLDAIAAEGGPLGFDPDDGTTVEVVRQKVVKLGDITDEGLYFEGGTAVPESAADVRRYLEQELAPGKTYGDEQVLTLNYVRYLPNAF